MTKILFYALKNFHLPHLEPIARWMNSYGKNVEIRFSSPDNGLKEPDLKDLSENGYIWISEDDVKVWKPDISILAEADYRNVVWGGKKVNVTHGLVSKGFFYTKSRFMKRDNASDLVCVPGEYHAELLNSVLNTAVVATGWVKFDDFISGKISRSEIRDSFNIPQDAEVITFAPTFNIELSAVPVVTDKIRKLVENDRYLLIKLHEVSSEKWFKMYRLLAKLEERVTFIEGNDITTALIAADVVISDVSTAFMEAIALGKPVVLIDSPYQKKFYNYNKNDIEYIWRDVALRVETLDELIEAVDRSFRDPNEKKQLRDQYGPRMVGEMDGDAAKRAAEAILNLMD
ncbi:MAG: CDP-glycerol glycerophosphotransferase family protein [Candidatus Electryonea clarkiae]|nr:CDP-glycerol glycerophosphotransferase family protein [Candidatus Electryonea clarkiae]MDP8286774.1 CDP-glycerol glycerophosphotransferase family protein [Candidatus Electryonea clarkiae]